MNIGEALNRHRERAMLTQEELGEKAGVSGYTVSRIEGEHVEPRFSTVRKLARALGIEPAELWSQKEEEPAPKVEAPPSEEAGRRSELEPWIMLLERAAEYVEVQTQDAGSPAFANGAAATAFMDRIVQEAQDIIDVFLEDAAVDEEPLDTQIRLKESLGRMADAMQAANSKADSVIDSGDDLALKRAEKIRAQGSRLALARDA